jgi:murein DD-endopeptidase MepM/ murein hydrolase activator NlpD
MAPGRPTSPIRLRRAAATLLGVLLSLSPQLARADTQSQLSRARARLSALESKIAAEKRQLAADKAQVEAVQGKLNSLAGDMAVARDRYDKIETQVMGVREELSAANRRYRALRGRLARRARIAYETGPVADLTFLLSADSLSDLSDRVAFVSSLNQNDTDLANTVQDQANALNMKRRALDGLLAHQTAVVRVLQRKQRELDAQFQNQKGIYDQEAQLVAGLTNDASKVNQLVARLRNQLQFQELQAARNAAQNAGILINGHGPFKTCPVQGPHAYSDDFGAPRTTTNPPHPHAGNDILAPRGTPIVAPFDGTATNASGGLGGNAVIVRGAQGYVYNAHLDRFGTLGRVKAGTVIGYVGNSGDAVGGPTHDHFEWHPDVIPAHAWRSPYGYTVVNTAIDPFPYLNMVC